MQRVTLLDILFPLFQQFQKIKEEIISSLAKKESPEKEKDSFGIKQLSADPFYEFFKDKNKGDIVSATITKISNNGIDVEVANFIETTIRMRSLSR